MKKAPTLSGVIRLIFLISFALLTFVGITQTYDKSNYTPVKNTSPVIATVIQREDSAAQDSLYVLGGADTVGAFPATGAAAAAVICLDTGEQVYGYNAQTPMGMASTTKIMTALVVLENCDPDSVVTVSPKACGVEGSSIYLVPGEKITIRDLLYGLMLESGNDAACALAIACSGSEEEFVRCMNEKARDLGLVNTHFDNPHGLSCDEHYTTASDLAVIACAAMRNTLFRDIVGTKTYIVTDENGNPKKYFANHNRMLFTYDGATGMKTGYTIATGRCLVTSACRNGTEFAVVTLNDRTDFRDHAALLDFAFSNYKTVTLAEQGDICGIFGGKRMENPSGIKVLIPKNGNAEKTDVGTVLESR